MQIDVHPSLPIAQGWMLKTLIDGRYLEQIFHGVDAQDQVACFLEGAAIPPDDPTVELFEVEIYRAQSDLDLDPARPPCLDCGEPWCSECETHYADCSCAGPHGGPPCASS